MIDAGVTAAGESRSRDVLAPAKLNLSLRVLARETSGFHQIETTLCLIELADEITVTLAGHDVTLDVVPPPDQTGRSPDLGPARFNLACRAAAAFRERTASRSGVHIRLPKRIPVGAGLGGGSSDAAAVLEALNELHDHPLSRDAIIQLAATLGSDVPFFAARIPFALAWGRGERLAPLTPPPVRAVLLAVPPDPVSTAAAYAALADAAADSYTPRAALNDVAPSWHHIAANAHNDFETVVFAHMPLLARLRAALHDSGASIARMTGTGSVVFGVFDSEAVLEDARTGISAAFPDVQCIATRTALR